MLNGAAGTFLLFASFLLPAYNKDEQNKTKPKKEKTRWQRSQREPETKQQESRDFTQD